MALTWAVEALTSAVEKAESAPSGMMGRTECHVGLRVGLGRLGRLLSSAAYDVLLLMEILISTPGVTASEFRTSELAIR